MCSLKFSIINIIIELQPLLEQNDIPVFKSKALFFLTYEIAYLIFKYKKLKTKQ